MRNSTFSEVASLTIRLMVVFFGMVMVSSCTEEDFVLGYDEPKIPETPGEEIADFRDLSFNHADWTYSNGLAVAEPNYNGRVIFTKNGIMVDSISMENQIAEQEISWMSIEETIGKSAQKQFTGYTCGAVKEISTENNQGLTITKFEKECKLSFNGMDVVLTGSWKEVSFNNSKADRCEYDYTTIVTQVSDTAMVDGAKEEVIVDGVKYNRVIVTAKAENYFNDYEDGQMNQHKEEMDIVYSTLVPVPVVEEEPETPSEPDMPNEIGGVDIAKTKQFGGLSWAWDAEGKPFISGTIVTANGVVSFWNGNYCFHKMNTNTIKARLGNSLYTENTNQYLIPSYIDVQSKPNKHWVYTDVNGTARAEVYGTVIEKLDDITLNQPFFGEPSETSETYNITSQDGSVRIMVKYKGATVFDHTFAN